MDYPDNTDRYADVEMCGCADAIRFDKRSSDHQDGLINHSTYQPTCGLAPSNIIRFPSFILSEILRSVRSVLPYSNLRIFKCA